MTFAFSFVFFLSGAAALVFETLWFREAGLMLGNSVWASSLVLASFMAGLALGNLIAARVGDRSRHPVHVYAALEAVIGMSGLALVFLFPAITPALAPFLGPFLDVPAVLNGIRLLTAFTLMLVPATAMGATLPLLVRALSSYEPDFGRVVGTLYGWNTLGAVAGALVGEAILVDRLGVRGAGVAAATLNGLAAVAALALAYRAETPPRPAAGDAAAAGLTRESLWLVAATCLAGALLLGLEVVWFRFLLLFCFGSTLTFALMLAVVLLGIGLGSLAASAWLRFRTDGERGLHVVAILAGVATALTYSGFVEVTARYGNRFLTDLPTIIVVSVRLMLPTSLLSGAFFALLGKRLKAGIVGEARTAATLTLANTVGAMVGAVGGGFVLLPRFGMERSFFLIACGYGVVAFCAWAGRSRDTVPAWGERVIGGMASLAFAAVLALFPFGLMRNHYLRVAASRWAEGPHIAAIREGLTETILYLRKDLWGEPVYYRLLTNGISMSSSHSLSRRYMNLFVYIPVALHPAPRRALLISYGLGSTAKALTDTEDLSSIDIVDISRDILDGSQVLFKPPDASPLADPRVRVHIEDGRFFLLTTDQRYDIITAEPPPPKNAGIGSLYSREYFHLIHDRLADGGIASYWLPVYQLEVGESKAVIRAFCDAFADCSLWTGSGYEWILLGTRHSKGPMSEDRFARQWRDPIVAPTLRALGLESPELIGSLFLADAPALDELTQGVAPVDDDHPHRIASRFPKSIDPFYRAFMDTEGARERFSQSAFVRRMWPESMRERSLQAFTVQTWLNRYFLAGFGTAPSVLPELAAFLTRTPYRTPVLWLLGSGAVEEGIAARAVQRGVRDPFLDETLGAQALADRKYLEAEEAFSRAQSGSAEPGHVLRLRVLSLCLAGRSERAAALVASTPQALTTRDPESWQWLAHACRIPSSFDEGGRTTERAPIPHD